MHWRVWLTEVWTIYEAKGVHKTAEGTLGERRFEESVEFGSRSHQNSVREFGRLSSKFAVTEPDSAVTELNKES